MSAATSTSRTGRHWRIGLLVDSLWDDFEAMVWRGVVDEARRRDVNLLCFAGGALRSPLSTHRNRTALHDLIGPQNVDGLLVAAGCVGNFLTRDETRQYLERFAPLPLLSLSVQFDDLPALVVDNRGGVHELVTHLIADHGCRRIAFIAGPKGNFDADERLAAYVQALADHGLPLDPELILPGNFMYGSGREAVQTLLAQRIEFDAIVAAADHMAVDALHSLQKAGIEVPRTVRVGGFDDMKDARGVIPTLTTVRQPTYELGREAVRQMLHWLDTGNPPSTRRLPTRLVTRASCGCLDATTGSPGSAIWQTDVDSTATSVDAGAAALAARLARSFRTISDILDSETWARELVDAYLADHRGEEGALAPALARAMMTSRTHPIEPAIWGEVLHALFALMAPRLPCASRVHDAAFLQVYQHMQVQQTGRWVEYELQTAALQRFQQPINAAFDMNLLRDIVRETLPGVGIDGFALALYDADDSRKRARLALELHTDNGREPTARGYDSFEAPRFAAAQLVPGGLDARGRTYCVNVFALAFEDEQFGFALYDIGRLDANLYEIVNSQLIALTKGVRLLEDSRHYTDKLQREVAARTAELRLANDTLQHKNREIEQLNTELTQRSRTDSLTGIYNRRAVLEMLKAELNRARRSHERRRADAPRDGDRRASAARTFSVMMFDLDRFKNVNDTHGHLVGDQVLKRIGALLIEPGVLRQEDIPGRFGGEEFIVILPDTDLDSALAPARRLTERLREIAFTGNGGETFGVTLSVGLSQFRPEDTDENAVIHRADLALYQAKNLGRDRIVCDEPVPAGDR